MSVRIPSRPTMYRLRRSARNYARRCELTHNRINGLMVSSPALRAADFPLTT